MFSIGSVLKTFNNYNLQSIHEKEDSSVGSVEEEEDSTFYLDYRNFDGQEHEISQGNEKNKS